jgi:hypothetical protein
VVDVERGHVRQGGHLLDTVDRHLGADVADLVGPVPDLRAGLDELGHPTRGGTVLGGHQDLDGALAGRTRLGDQLPVLLADVDRGILRRRRVGGSGTRQSGQRDADHGRGERGTETPASVTLGHPTSFYSAGEQGTRAHRVIAHGVLLSESELTSVQTV